MMKRKNGKRIIALLIAALILQSISPAMGSVISLAASPDEEVTAWEGEDFEFEAEGEEGYLTEEELAEFEADQLLRDQEDESFKVDDSDKLLDKEEDGEASFEWLFGKTVYSNDFGYYINNQYKTSSMDVAIQNAATLSLPIFLQGNVEIKKTIQIPKGKTVEIYTNGYQIGSDSKALGGNALFKVLSGATFRIYGKDHSYIRGGGDGAIIAESESTLVLHNLNFFDNSAGRNGGAIYLDSKVSCTLNNVYLTSNRAGNNGGALYVNGSNCNVHIDADAKFENNTAGGHGGAIYVDGEKVNLYGPAAGKVKVSYNTARGSGGAIYGNKKNLNVTSFEMTNNKAEAHGGAVYFDSEADSITNCIINNNTATKDGGGVYINGTADSISDVEIMNNICGYEYYGGGVYVDSRYNLGTSGKVVITNNYFGSSGGALSDLFLQEGKLTAYVKAANYTAGSKIGIGVTKWKEGRRLTYATGSFNPKVFYANWAIRGNNGGEYYVALNSERHLVLTKSKDLALDADETKLSAEFKTKMDKVDGRQYLTSAGEAYPIYYGFATSPSHTDEAKDIVNKFFYSDGYFMEDPSIYNNHLATLGMNMAMASANSNYGGHDDYSNKYVNIKNMMMAMGCAEGDIYISPSYKVKPTTSSIGVAIGKKSIKKADGTDSGYILVPIAIRSYGYEKEWASNMTINGNNTSDGHETSGFRDAATQVMSAVDGYISQHGLAQAAERGKIKFWLSGFSRGSATANLVSKRLVDKYGSLSEKYKNNPNQIFGYCYAVPAGGTDQDDLSIQNGGDGSAYYCIHNIINKVDLTPMVAPKEMGFKRYGVDHYVPGGDRSSVTKTVGKATDVNKNWPITTFYDNTAYLTNSTSYSNIRGSMLIQLMYVNDEIHFVDYFKEADINLGKAKAAGQFIKGIFTEAQYVTIDEVSGSTVILEDWLPEFYKAVQEYNTVGANTRLTRDTYSSVVVKGGKNKDKYAVDEPHWAEMGTTAQDTFRGLVEMMLSKTPTEKANLGAAFSGVKNKMTTWQMYRLYENLINNKTGWDDSEDIQQKYLELFWGWLSDGSYGQKSINTAITDPAERAQFQNYFPSLLGITMRVVRQDFTKHGDKMRLLGTFANNTEAILQGHVPEIALAWLRRNDDYYANEKTAYVWATGSETGLAPRALQANLSAPVVENDADEVIAADEFSVLEEENAELDEEIVISEEANETEEETGIILEEEGTEAELNAEDSQPETDAEPEPVMFYGAFIPDEIVVPWNEENKDNRFAAAEALLPATAEIAVSDDSITSLPVTWDLDFTSEIYSGDEEVEKIEHAVAYEKYGYAITREELNGTDDFSLVVVGTVTVPEGMSYYVSDYDAEDSDDDGYELVISKGTEDDQYLVECEVTLVGAYQSVNPGILPASEMFDPGESFVVELDEGDFAIEEHSSVDVDIYYIVTPLEFEEMESGNKYPVQDYTQAGYDDEGNVIFIAGGDSDAEDIKANLYVADADGDIDAYLEDFEKRIIDSKKYPKGACVYAVALEEGCRLSPVSSEFYAFDESEIEEEDIETEFEGWTLPVGGRLSDLTEDLPNGCQWHPDMKTDEVVSGTAGESITAKVVYNPDPSQYMSKVFEISILLVPGAHDLYVEGGKAFVYNPDDDTETELKDTKVDADSLIILEANKPKEGEEFIGWLVYGENEEDVAYELDQENELRIGIVMPEQDVFAIALYYDENEPDIDDLSFGADEEFTLAPGETKSIRAIPKLSGEEVAEQVTYAVGDGELIKISDVKADKTIDVTALKTGKTVVWAYCGSQIATCTVNVQRADVSLGISGGIAYDIIGNALSIDTIAYGSTVTVKAEKDESKKFVKWIVTKGSIGDQAATQEEITFQILEDTIIEAVFEDAEGYEDQSKYAEDHKADKVKSLKVTDSNSKKVTNVQIPLGERVSIYAEAVYDTSKPDVVFINGNSDVLKVKTEKTGEGKATGTLIGKHPGTATVTAVCGNKKVNINVTVEGAAVDEMIVLSDRAVKTEVTDFGDYRLELNSGEQELLELIPANEDAISEIKITWKSDDTSVATVKNGLVTAKEADRGNTTVTATPLVKPLGATKWTKLDPIKIVVAVKHIAVPKKVANDKSYKITLKKSQKLDVNTAPTAEITAKLSNYDAAKGKNLVWSSTNEGIVSVGDVSEIVQSGKAATMKAGIKANGIGTAYIVLKGTDNADETKANIAVMKVVVKASKPKISITNAAIGDIEYAAGDKVTMTMKKGSYDRIYYLIESDMAEYNYNTTETVKVSGSGGVTVKNGLIYAKSATKAGKPAKVKIKCGKSEVVLEITVTER